MTRMIFWTGLLVGVVVLQTTVMPYLSVWGVTPDIGLVVACFIGLLAGELPGVVAGVCLGWFVGLFSAGDLLSGMVVKAMAGFLAGLAGRQMAQVTPLVLVSGLLVGSAAGGLLTLWEHELSAQQDVWWALRMVIVPQACYDAVLGGLAYWVIWSQFDVDRLVAQEEF